MQKPEMHLCSLLAVCSCMSALQYRLCYRHALPWRYHGMPARDCLPVSA